MNAYTDVEKLREAFAWLDCAGVVALIDFLDSEQAEGLWSIGSSTIGLGEILNEIWVSKEAQWAAAWFRTRSQHIGSKDGSVTPLQWLEKLSQVFNEVSEPVRREFDKSCGEFALMAQLEPCGDVVISTSDGIFRVPPGVYHRHMTVVELAPYKVERSLLDSGDDGSEVATTLH